MYSAFNRKKVIFLFLFFTLIKFQSFGQNIIEGYWGVKSGLNINKISKLEYINNYKPGFHLGVFANFQLNEKFSVQHEVLYSMKGVSLDLSSGNGVKYSKSFSFLDIPIALNYHLTPNFMITGGIQPSVYAYFKTPKADTVLYNKDNVNPIDCSYLLGASFLFKNNLGFGVRFTGGLVPAFDINDYDGKHNVLQVFLVYAVNKKKIKKSRKR
jgi:hypothetical protein